MHMVFTTERLSEVTMESWSEWGLNPPPLKSVQMLKPTEPSGHESNTHSEPALYSYPNFIVCSVSDFISAVAFVSRGEGIWAMAYGIHQWRISWSSYTKSAWVGFEPTTTEFRSDALTNRGIKPWVQLAFRANFVDLPQFHLLVSVRFYFSYCLRQSPRLFYLKFSWGNQA